MAQTRARFPSVSSNCKKRSGIFSGFRELQIYAKHKVSVWILYAVGSAFFAGLTSILAKCGLRDIDSTLATALRTIVVLIFIWAIVLATGSSSDIGSIDGRTWTFLILSGFCTGASWLCYYKALKLGDVNKVVPIDKSSTVITIILATVLLGESLSVPGVIGTVLIGVGTMLMIEKKQDVQTLRSMGATDRQICHIFMFEGRMISLAGAVIGLLLGLLLCWLQQEYGLISMGESEGNFIVEAYPVSVHPWDLVLIFVTVLLVGWAAVWYPVRYLSKNLL